MPSLSRKQPAINSNSRSPRGKGPSIRRRTLSAFALPVALVGLGLASGLVHLPWQESASFGQLSSVRRPVPSAWEGICAASPASSRDVQDMVTALRATAAPATEHAPPVVVVAIPARLGRSLAFAGSARRFMGMSLLIWNKDADVRGTEVYHELIHLSQLALDRESQNARADSVLAAVNAGHISPFTWHSAWGSVQLALTATLSEAKSEAFIAEIERKTAVAHASGALPVPALLSAIHSTAATPEFRGVARRLAADGDRDLDLVLRRLLAFEAEAYAVSDMCGTA